MKITRNGTVLEVTEKAFNVVYKHRGYKKYEEESSLEDLTVKELREKAKEQNIEGYYDMKKEELIQAMGGG